MGQHRPGDVVGGRYRVIQVLGEGGMASVYLALDSATGTQVALKLLHAHAHPSQHTRFFREVRALASIDHPSCVRFLDWGVHEATPYLVMEHVAGKALQQILAAGRLGAGEAVAIALAVAEALEAIHARGLIHRDLTPANIMVLSRGARPRIQIIDFGIAKIAPAPSADRTHPLPLTSQGSVIGTPPYAAPEQLRAGSVDARADVYALGALLYRMVTGKPPHDGGAPLRTACLQLSFPPAPPRELVPDLDLALEHVILRCLRIAPAERYASSGALRAALGVLAPPPARALQVVRGLVVCAAAGLALGATAACWLIAG